MAYLELRIRRRRHVRPVVHGKVRLLDLERAMGEEQGHEQHPRFVFGWAVKPFEGGADNTFVIVIGLGRISKSFVEEPAPNVVLDIFSRTTEFGYELGRLEEAILVDGQLGHGRSEGVAPRGKTGNVVSAPFLERAEQVGLPGLDQRLERPMARHVGVVAREHAASGLGAYGSLDEAIGEAGALGGEGIDVWRFDHLSMSAASCGEGRRGGPGNGSYGVAGASQRVIAKLIRHEDYEVGPLDLEPAWSRGQFMWWLLAWGRHDDVGGQFLFLDTQELDRKDDVLTRKNVGMGRRESKKPVCFFLPLGRGLYMFIYLRPADSTSAASYYGRCEKNDAE
jgi:hypothetical protein